MNWLDVANLFLRIVVIGVVAGIVVLDIGNRKGWW